MTKHDIWLRYVGNPYVCHACKLEWTDVASLATDASPCREISGHTRDCVDAAACAAWENHTVDDYPSPAATATGLELLNADLVDCRCED